MVDPLIIGAIVVGALSAASYYQQRKMQRQAEKQANEMASHQISGHDSNRALYTVYGRALIGTTTIYKRVSRRNIPMSNANFINFVGGGGSPSTESKTYGLNRFLYRISSLSNGPINGIENVLIDGEKYTANRFTAGHTKHFESAVSLGPTAGNHFANLRTSYATDFSAWGADKKGQGVAYVVERFWFDKSNPAYQGEPQTQYLVKGRSLYDPRLDSTVSGGSGSHRSDTPSTWTFSDNPVLALLDMLTNQEYGRGVSHADCNMATFIAAANKCDVLVDIPARATNTTGATMVVYDPHTGTTHEIPDNGTISNYRIDQVTTGTNANKQKRFRLNMAVDNSKEVLDNIQQILQSFRGNLHHINGDYVVHMDDVASPVLTLTDDDIIGGLKIAQGDRKQRINRMTVKFLNANKHYKTDQVSWPPIDSDSSSQYQTYLTADSGEKLHKTVTLTGCTDYYQAEDIAEYLVRESRVTLAVSGTFGSRCFNLVPGDVIALDYDSAGYSGKYFIVDQVGVDVASMNVKLSLREYDSSVYTWNTARGNEPVALYFDEEQQYNATPTSLTLGTVSSAVITLADGTATVSLVVNYSGVPEEATAVEIGWAPTGTTEYTTNVMQEDATKTKFQLGIDNQDIDIRVRYIVTNADGLQMPSGYATTTFTLPAVSGTRLGGMDDNATRNTGVLADRDTVDTVHIEADAVTAAKIDVTDIAAINADLGAITSGSLRSGNITNPIPTDIFTRSSNQNIPTGSENGAFVDLDNGRFVFGDSDSFISFADNSAGTARELDIKGVLAPTELDFSGVSALTVMPNTIKASGYTDASIGKAALSEEAYNEIAARIGNTGGFYETATGFYLGSTKYIALANTPTHTTRDVTVRVAISDVFTAPASFVVNSNGVKVVAKLFYKLASETNWNNQVQAGATQTFVASPTVLQYATRYTINASYEVTLTSGSGQTIADNTNYDFRVELTRLASPNAFQAFGSGGANDSTGTPVTLEVSEGTQVVAGSGNADTLDNLESAQFLRSDTDDTFSGNLTITGDLILQGGIDQYNVTNLTVDDKTITVNAGSTQALSDGAGLIIDRGTAADASITWDETNDKFTVTNEFYAPTIAGDDLVLGQWAGNGAYGALLHKNHTGTEYMIISRDDHTYISATTGYDVKIRGGNNVSTYEIIVYPDQDATASGNKIWHGGDFTSTNISNWNTAYGWGDHSTQGYLTAEADTLATVTGRGATTTNAISTGAITTTSINNSTGAILRLDNGTYTILQHPENGAVMYLGDSGDRSNYYQNNAHHFRHSNASTYFALINSSGVNVRSGGLLIDYVTAIDSSRNASLGTIASGAITSSGQITAKTAVLTDDGSGSPLLKISADDNQPWAIQLYREDLGGGPQVFASNTNTWSFQGHINLRSTYAYQVDGTTVIDSNRNLTNIGTISSGAITSSGNITGAGLIIDGNTAVDKSGNYMVFYDGSGNPALYAGNTADNRNYYQSDNHRFRSNDAGTNFAEIGSLGMIIGTHGPEANMGKLHVKDSDSGATPYQSGNGGITIERNGRAALNFLTPSNQDAYVFFGDPQSANAGYVGYEHANQQLVLKSQGYVKAQGSGVNIHTGILQMGGVGIIDNARNIQAAAISSAAISALGEHTFTGVNTSNGTLRFVANTAKGARVSHVHYGANGDWYIRSAGSGGSVFIQDGSGVVSLGTISSNLTFNTGAEHITFGSGGTNPSWSAPKVFRTSSVTIGISDYSGVQLGGYNGTAYGPRLTVHGTGNVDILEGALRMGTTTVISSTRRFYADTGTVAKAAYSFDGESNTGMYKYGTNQIGFTVGGTLKAYIQDSTYSLVVSGKISSTGGNSDNWNTAYGWGDHSAAGYLQTNDNITVGTISSGAITASAAGAVASFNRTDNDAIIELKRSGSVKGYIGANTSGDIKFYNSSAAGTLTISSAGNLGTSGTISSGAITATNGNVTITTGYNLQWGSGYSGGHPSISATSNAMFFYPTGNVSGANFRLYASMAEIRDGNALRFQRAGNSAYGELTYDSGENITLYSSWGGKYLRFTREGHLQLSGTTVIDASRVVQNVTLKAGGLGSRFEQNSWHQSADGYNRFYFAAASHTYFRTGDHYIFRNNGDSGVATLSGVGGLNLKSSGDTVIGSTVALAVGGTTTIDSSRNVFGVNGSFTGYAAIGARVGTISPSLSVDGATNSSPFLAKSGSYSTVFSVLPWSDAITYLASGTYYQGGSWIHASPNDYECLLGISGDAGAKWYVTSNGVGGSWNHASNVQLWNNSGVWVNTVNTGGSITAGNGSTSLGYYVGTTQVIQGSTRNLVNIGTITAGLTKLTPSGWNQPSGHAALNTGYNGSGETRAIDMHGHWSTGESKSITATHGSSASQIVAQINMAHKPSTNTAGSSIRWGKLYHGGDSSLYTMELHSESTAYAYLDINRTMVNIGQDSTYGAGYGVIGFGGRSNGYNRVFGRTGTQDGLYLASATGHGIYMRPNGADVTKLTVTAGGQVEIQQGDITLGQDGTYGSNYGTIGFGGTSNGSNRIFARNNATDGLYLAAATGAKVKVRANGLDYETFALGFDDTYSGYASLGFGGALQNGYNRIFASTGNSDGIYINAATGRQISFRVNGQGTDAFKMDSQGRFVVGSTIVLDQSRHLQNISSFSKIFSNRQSATAQGISWYSSGYKAWATYMAQAGQTSVGPTADITAPSGTLVTSWALRNFIENAGGYGWTFESGTATGQPSVVAEIRASDGAAKFGASVNAVGGFLMDGTTVISNDAFRGRDYIRAKNSGQIVMTMNHGTYTMLRNPLGATRIWMGSTGYSGAASDDNNYYNGATHFFRSESSVERARINTNGVDARSGGFLINGTTVIDSTRNLTNIASITTTGTMGLGTTPNSANYLLIDRVTGNPNIKSSDAYLLMDSSGGMAGLNWYSSDRVVLANGGGNVSIGSSGNHTQKLYVSGAVRATSSIRADGGFLVSGTTVIDSSRNLTNIGTVASGQISATVNSAQEYSSTELSEFNAVGSDALFLYNSESTSTYGKVSIMMRNNGSGGAASGRITLKNNRSGSSAFAFFLRDNGHTGDQREKLMLDSDGNLNASGSYGIQGTTVIDSSRNLTNIGTISSGAITSTGSVNLGNTTDGSRRFKWYNDNNHSLYYDDNVLGTASAEVFTYWQNVVFRHRDSTNAVIIGGSAGTISSGAITSTGTSTFNNFRLTDASRMGFGTVRAGASVGHNASTDEGIFWHTGNDYGIYRTSGNWSSPDYQQLRIRWATGIELYGGSNYGKSGVNIVDSKLMINGTTVISSSRNATFASMTSTGLVEANNYQVGGQVVIDSSRRFGANAAPNASYAINALQNGSLTRAAYLQANGGTGTGLEINATAGTYSGDALYVRQSTVSTGGNLARFANSSGDVFAVTTGGSVAMGGTTVIDSVRRFYASSGTSVKAAFSFDGDSTTGLYRPAASQVAVIAGATDALYMNNNREVIIGGKFSNNHYNSVSRTRLSFGGGNDLDNYFIGTTMENYGGNYTKLDLRWHTGIRMGAQPNYGGIRFFNSEDLGSVLVSIGKGDANTRIENGNFYVESGSSYINTGSLYMGSTQVIDASRNGVFVNLRADGGNLIMGDEAFSSSSSYVGMKTAHMSGSNDYMIISGLGDGNTYVSAKDGASAYIRGGGNRGTNQIEVPDSSTITATTSNFYCTGNVTAYYSSDESLKTNIRVIDSPIERIKKIRGVFFDWTDDYIKEQSGDGQIHVRKDDVGVIAQDVQPVLDEVVTTRDDGTLAVRYEKMVALCIEAIKDQQDQIDLLKETIEEMKNGNN